MVVVRAFFLNIPDFDLVCIGWRLVLVEAGLRVVVDGGSGQDVVTEVEDSVGVGTGELVLGRVCKSCWRRIGLILNGGCDEL
ncbi:hypothetical protein F0562_023721 [Nyssa sinensis]|uniref:Uncharacterized protein n=1 Tax=Nyssa sinensis TaxID=561372 RepID=A0A5J5BIJ3_9ASTE|nr:hypothetical protein F0562_023721 [Nyssa sinensis]